MREPYSYRDDPQVPPFDDAEPVVVMDADCALCSWGARTIHGMDRSGAVRICPIQSPLGTGLMRHYGYRAENPDSWLFIEDGVAYSDMDALIQVGRTFGGWGRLASLMLILPRFLRKRVYRLVARNRYRLFGKGDMCAVPDPEFQKRLIG
ncbi:thiol-disulfide oxidoreductase DCC family protein [Amaricoccus tamworthensis]|uniref:thiol-disulfide oxidoreductase DCC family protein n=1 Tax=Amaricoccus tamworthensis TaxID=57002 RepID=UPI003C7DCD7D